MVSPCFANIGSEKKFSLADLSVTGYDKSEYLEGEWQNGCTEGMFELKVLGNGGTVDAHYFWIDYKYGEDEQNPEVDMKPGWYLESKVGKELVYTLLTDGEAKAITFDQGQSFWTFGTGLQLVTAGQVTAKDLAIKMNDKKNTAAGNAMPYDMTLGDLTVDGYDKSEYIEGEWQNGCTEGMFELKILGNGGTVDAHYFWIDYKYGEDEQNPEVDMKPGWYTESKVGKELVYTLLTKEELDAIKVPAGQGYWIFGTGLKLIVPAPEWLKK